MQFKLLSLFFISCCLLLSCKSTTEESNNKKVGGIDLKDARFFYYNQASGITSLDPAFAKDQANIWAINQLFNGLVQMDNNLNIKPCIAKSWTISDDGLTYTFQLRGDVYFHDHELFEGKKRKVTAADIVYSMERIVDEKVASTGAWLFTDRLDATEPFKALDEQTFVLKLSTPFRPMLGILSMQYCSVVPKEVVGHFGKEFRKHPIGTGPFQFKAWREGETLVMLKNPNYFEQDVTTGKQLPHLDGVRVSFIENKRNAFLKFKEGKLHLLSGIDATYKDDLLTAEGTLKSEWTDKIQLLRSPYLNTEYLGILNKNNPNKALQNKLVRQAINYGFDRAKMVKFLRNNVGSAANSGFVPKGLPSFDATKVKGYSYNPEKARALLKEAGYENGKGLPEIVLETNSSYKDLCTFIQNQLAEIGIKLRLETHPPSFLRTKMSKGESSFFRASWIGDYPDSETYLTVLHGQNPAPPNYTQFNNAAYNKLYQEALKENDDTKRYELYQAMDRILIEEAPIVPLFYDEVLRFTQNEVKGLGVNAFNLLSLKEVRLD